MRARCRFQAGFTLIELLAVIAIVSMLIALLLPALGASRSASRAIKCSTQLNQMALALSGYLGDSGGYYTAGHREESLTRYYYVWMAQLRRYAGGYNEVFNCPSAYPDFFWHSRFDPDNTYVASWGRTIETFGYLPDEVQVLGGRPGEFFTSGYNEWGVVDFQALAPDEITLGLGGHATRREPWAENLSLRAHDGINESRIVQPAAMIAIADAIPTGYDDAWIQPGSAIPDTNPSSRHEGGCRVLWVDGHVSAEQTARLVAPTYAMRRLWNNDHDPHEDLWQDVTGGDDGDDD